MHLDLANYIVGVSSFWNLVLPAISVIVFVLGLIVFAASKPARGLHPALILAGVGLVLFVVAAIGDEVGNAHDVTALESAVQARYGVSIDYAGAADLFGDRAGAASSSGGETVTTYGRTDLDVGGATETVSLERLADGSYILATADGKELSTGS